MSGRRESASIIEQGVASGERRSTLRYSTAGTPVLIGWSEGAGHRTIPGILINISLGGCAAQVSTFPPTKGNIWIRLAAPQGSPWIHARVIETIKRGCLAWTRRLVRVRFTETCPYDLFKAAIEGFSRENQLPDFDEDGFSVRDWR